MDNPKKRKADGYRIALSQRHERIWWCHALRASDLELAMAVLAVGTSVAAVRRFFRRARSTVARHRRDKSQAASRRKSRQRRRALA